MKTSDLERVLKEARFYEHIALEIPMFAFTYGQVSKADNFATWLAHFRGQGLLNRLEASDTSTSIIIVKTPLCASDAACAEIAAHLADIVISAKVHSMPNFTLSISKGTNGWVRLTFSGGNKQIREYFKGYADEAYRYGFDARIVSDRDGTAEMDLWTTDFGNVLSFAQSLARTLQCELLGIFPELKEGAVLALIQHASTWRVSITGHRYFSECLVLNYAKVGLRGFDGENAHVDIDDADIALSFAEQVAADLGLELTMP